MTFFESIVEFDEKLFLTLNGTHTQATDHLALIFSSIPFWIPVYVFLLYMLYRREKFYVFLSFLVIALMIVITDQCSNLIKDAVVRFRPAYNHNVADHVRLLTGKGGFYSFVSAHAANSFAGSMFFCGVFTRPLARLGLISWATLVSYSRIYVGRHYPTDIVCGAILGLLIGYLMYRLKVYLCGQVRTKLEKLKQDRALRQSNVLR